MADGPSFLYEKLVRETWHKKFVYKSHTEQTIQVPRTRNTADDRDDKEFQILIFFRIALHNQQNCQKDEKKTKQLIKANNEIL